MFYIYNFKYPIFKLLILFMYQYFRDNEQIITIFLFISY